MVLDPIPQSLPVHFFGSITPFNRSIHHEVSNESNDWCLLQLGCFAVSFTVKALVSYRSLLQVSFWYTVNYWVGLFFRSLFQYVGLFCMSLLGAVVRGEVSVSSVDAVARI